ncbi:DUF952 domain-containing protein [Pseudomonadales bacterium]|jgi:uncharacterized protein (DUF952 family)|nr:DUF952 domain-containing protein [Pseudomonadales bacterium]
MAVMPYRKQSSLIISAMQLLREDYMKPTIRLFLLITCLAIASVSIADTTLYHIVSEKELQTLTKDNVYTPASVELEGYIHFSKIELILPIANDAYIDREILYLLQVTFDDDDKYLRWIGDNPDYWRGLDLAMVEHKLVFSRDKNGLWVLPKLPTPPSKTW